MVEPVGIQLGHHGLTPTGNSRYTRVVQKCQRSRALKITTRLKTSSRSLPWHFCEPTEFAFAHARSKSSTQHQPELKKGTYLRKYPFLIWWSRWELNPRPKKILRPILHKLGYSIEIEPCTPWNRLAESSAYLISPQARMRSA